MTDSQPSVPFAERPLPRWQEWLLSGGFGFFLGAYVIVLILEMSRQLAPHSIALLKGAVGPVTMWLVIANPFFSQMHFKPRWRRTLWLPIVLWLAIASAWGISSWGTFQYRLAEEAVRLHDAANQGVGITGTAAEQANYWKQRDILQHQLRGPAFPQNSRGVLLTLVFVLSICYLLIVDFEYLQRPYMQRMLRSVQPVPPARGA